jgi:NB-ARC domain
VRLGYAPQIDEDDFIGRDDELKQLQTWLAPQSGRQNVVALCGMGGMGKTQLSIHFIKQSRSQYSTVLWLNAKDENTLKAGLAALATEVAETPASSILTDAHEEEQLVQHTRQWLSQSGNNKWLLVCDNYDNPCLPGIDSSTGYDIRTYFPQHAQGSILITTRSPRLSFAKQLRLGKLEKIEQSLAILAARSGRQVNGGELKACDDEDWSLKLVCWLSRYISNEARTTSRRIAVGTSNGGRIPKSIGG